LKHEGGKSEIAQWRNQKALAIIKEFTEGPGTGADAMFALGQVFAVLSLEDEWVLEAMNDGSQRSDAQG
jgi:hypothetical protein